MKRSDEHHMREFLERARKDMERRNEMGTDINEMPYSWLGPVSPKEPRYNQKPRLDYPLKFFRKHGRFQSAVNEMRYRAKSDPAEHVALIALLVIVVLLASVLFDLVYTP